MYQKKIKNPITYIIPDQYYAGKGGSICKGGSVYSKKDISLSAHRESLVYTMKSLGFRICLKKLKIHSNS